MSDWVYLGDWILQGLFGHPIQVRSNRGDLTRLAINGNMLQPDASCRPCNHEAAEGHFRLSSKLL